MLLFKDQRTSTATVGSAALQQLHAWMLLRSISPLYQNMPTYAGSNLSHHSSCSQLHHEIGLTRIMLQVSVTVKKPSKAIRITLGTSTLLKGWSIDPSRQLTPTQSFISSFSLGWGRELEERMWKKLLGWDKNSLINKGRIKKKPQPSDA